MDCKKHTEYIWFVTNPSEDKLRFFTWCRCRLTDLANHIRIRVTLVTFIVLFLHTHRKKNPLVLKIENTFFQYRNIRSVPKSDTPMFFLPTKWVSVYSYACYICHSVMPDEHSRPISCSAKLPAGRWDQVFTLWWHKLFNCHKKIITLFI